MITIKKIMKVLLGLVLVNSHILFSEAIQNSCACRPPGFDDIFNFICNSSSIIRVNDAFFGKTATIVEGFCNNPFPNRTEECIPQRNENTRNIRLACNAVREQCAPRGQTAMIQSDTFESCTSQALTYGCAFYDCLPAYRSNGSVIDYIYLNSPSFQKTVGEKVYLMSNNYDVKSYTTLAFGRTLIKISAGSSLRFTVLDLYGLSTGGPPSPCPYNLSINSESGGGKTWCGQPNWNYFEVYELNIPSTGSQQTVTVTFSSANNDAVQGRVWILVEVSRSDGSVATMEITSGSPPITTSSTTTSSTSPTTTTTTPSTTTPTTTTTTTTSTSTTTTTTTPSTTTTTSTTTTIPSTSTSSTTITTTTTKTTPVISTRTTKITPSITPSTLLLLASTRTPYVSLNPPSSTTTTSSTVTTSPSTTISTSTTSSTTMPSTSASTANTISSSSVFPAISPGLTSESATSILESPSVSHTVGNESEPAVTARPASDTGSPNVVAIAVGVSVACIVLIFVSIPVIICLCMYCSSKRAKARSPRPSPAPASGTVTRNPEPFVHSANPKISKQHSSGDSGSGGSGSGGEEIYSEINESSIGVTIIHTGTMKSNDPSTVKFSVTYKVGGPANGRANKDKSHYDMYNRIRGRPAQLDNAGWSDIQEVDSPPPYSDGAIKSVNYKQVKRGRSKDKKSVTPVESGESDTEIQHNPLYGLGLQQTEDYNY